MNVFCYLVGWIEKNEIHPTKCAIHNYKLILVRGGNDEASPATASSTTVAFFTTVTAA
jgi:hypothetical protein